jgi:hypothetical protein
MLTARPPFTGDTMMNTLMKVLNDEPVSPKRLNPSIHRDIQTIVLKAMEKPLDRRYPTMRAFAADLRHFVAGESISARPAGAFYRAWKFLKRHYAAVFATAAVAAVAAAAAAIVLDVRRESVRLERESYDAGKMDGVQEVERKVEEEEKPSFKAVFEDDFSNPSLAERWVIEENSPWRIAEGRQLEAAGGTLAAIHTKRADFTGRVTVTFEACVDAGAEGAARPEPLIGCFLGPDWGHSCRVSFGGGQRLALANQFQEIAEVKCPPLRPGTWYHVTLERDAIGLQVLVEAEGNEPPLKLAYKDLTLPRQLHRQFAAGLFTSNTRLRVRRFAVQQEFPPKKLSAIKAAEGLFRDDNIPEARNQYLSIAKGHEGHYEGLAALLGVAQCHEAERRYREAAAALRRIEDLAPQITHDELPALLSSARLRRFFTSTSLNDFADAAGALARMAAARDQADEAWVWHFPDPVGQMITNRAYDEALAVLRAELFGPERRTLHATVQALQASALDARLVSRVTQLADGLCNSGLFGKVREIYEAYPTKELADAFARAANHSLQRGQPDEALALLAFCHQERMARPTLNQAAMDLATKLCEAGAHARVANVYEAFPDPKLASAFTRAIRQATDAGRLDDALTLVRKHLKNFPADARKLLGSDGPAVRLCRAYVARKELLKPIDIYALFEPPPDDPALLPVFVEATQAAVAAKDTDAAVRLLEHCRARFGVLHPELAAAAAKLLGLVSAGGAYDKAAVVFAAYPNEALAAPMAKAMGDATRAGRLRDALALLGHYALKRYPIPADALRALAERLAALSRNDEETTALLAEYRKTYELYESPVARSTFTLALGDAYVRAGRLREAASQYEAAGDAEGILRAACAAAELREPGRAASHWKKLRELAKGNDDKALIAAWMLGESGPAELGQSAAGKLPAPLAHYLTGLRLWMDADDRAADEFARAASDPPSWFTPLAKRSRTSAEGNEP